MKKLLVGFGTLLALFGLVGLGKATLVTIGTATYEDENYNLIWDDDNNGSSLIWFDYRTYQRLWAAQMDWVADLSSYLTLNIVPEYNISWNDDAWRLPSAGSNPAEGYYQHRSELGHLFYNELNLPPNPSGQHSSSDLNSSNFDELSASWYYSGQTSSGIFAVAWPFNMGTGFQGYRNEAQFGRALAVRSAEVSKTTIPEPNTILLIGIGTIYLLLTKRRHNKK